MHFVAHLLPSEANWDYRSNGFDTALLTNTFKAWLLGPSQVLRRRLAERTRPRGQELIAYVRERSVQAFRRVTGGFRNAVLYADAMRFFSDVTDADSTLHPSAIPNWDNTPRSGYGGVVLHESTPELFGAHLREIISRVAARPLEERVVFVKSWNEWAEGNYLEPDQRFGHGYLNAVREAVVVNEPQRPSVHVASTRAW
jgi:hypothetical protein